MLARMLDNEIKKVLVIEDEDALFYEIRIGLGDNNISALQSRNVSDAIFKTKNQKFDCIVVDLRLERGEGDEFIDIVRCDPKNLNHKTPIILASGFITKAVLGKVNDQVQDILAKPYSLRDLHSTIEKNILRSKKNLGLAEIEEDYLQVDTRMEESGSTILYIEDERDLAIEIIDELENANLGVVHFTTEKEALKATKDVKFNCIIVDINLEEGKGDSFILKMRNDPDNLNRETPVIMASSHLDINVVNKLGGAIQGGVVKPYSILDLLDRLSRFIPELRKNEDN
ncbi:MAG: hypothetical protein CME70_20070 [Halobacteriovorax sp.]|nr:hypothetical protein [Halobacteriovorax sp.]|tara:strand:+ start:81726 stop:82580 length:855 start_codon:yes stop_codon:yes gene_type:complete